MTHVPPSERRRTRQGGFSFIEILIVMGIIAVLVGMVVVAIQIWGKKGPEFRTKQRMQKVEIAAKAIHLMFSTYAPVDTAQLSQRLGIGPEKIKVPNNRTNQGIESLVQAMYWKGLTHDPGLGDDEFCNTDEDELGEPVGKRNNTQLFEVQDDWGNPLIYFDHQSYGKATESPMQVMNARGDTYDAKPWQNEDGSYPQAESFQLFSMGPDGEPNTSDDLKHWE